MVKLIWELGENMSISEYKRSEFGGYIMHAQKIHRALIPSLIIYQWIIKHLQILYQGNPGDQSLAIASSSIQFYF